MQRPFEGGAATGEQHDVFVGRIGGKRHVRRRGFRQSNFPHTVFAQSIEDVGHVPEQNQSQPRQKRMRVAKLWDTGPRPGGERSLRFVHREAGVALQYDHPDILSAFDGLLANQSGMDLESLQLATKRTFNTETT